MWFNDYKFDSWKDYANLEDLRGKTVKDVQVVNNAEIYFLMDDGYCYKMFHDQDCCETVYIDSIVGDLENLIGEKIFTAEENSNSGESEYGSVTWTFYRINTFKNSVVIMWRGESNGYYSESVDFVKSNKKWEIGER